MEKQLIRRVICGMMILSMISLCACAPAVRQTSFEAMDTFMSLSVSGPADIAERIQARAEAMDEALSAVDENSEIYALNHSGRAELSESSAALLSDSLRLCGELEGFFDVTVYPAVYEWGFTTGDYAVPDPARLAELAAKIDYRSVSLDGNIATLPEGVMLDLGAVAKGRLADEALTILADSSADHAVLNLGGTVALYGRKPDSSPFKVGVADPDEPASFIGVLSLSGGVVATSGGYERYFERGGRRYIHILDPATAEPVDNGVASVTVVADSGILADALSTALFVMGVQRAREYYRAHGGFDYAMLTESGELYISEGIADSFTPTGSREFTVIPVAPD